MRDIIASCSQSFWHIIKRVLFVYKITWLLGRRCPEKMFLAATMIHPHHIDDASQSDSQRFFRLSDPNQRVNFPPAYSTENSPPFLFGVSLHGGVSQQTCPKPMHYRYPSPFWQIQNPSTGLLGSFQKCTLHSRRFPRNLPRAKVCEAFVDQMCRQQTELHPCVGNADTTCPLMQQQCAEPPPILIFMH
jgi:hypothetical protein